MKTARSGGRLRFHRKEEERPKTPQRTISCKPIPTRESGRANPLTVFGVLGRRWKRRAILREADSELHGIGRKTSRTRPEAKVLKRGKERSERLGLDNLKGRSWKDKKSRAQKGKRKDIFSRTRKLIEKQDRANCKRGSRTPAVLGSARKIKGGTKIGQSAVSIRGERLTSQVRVRKTKKNPSQQSI